MSIRRSVFIPDFLLSGVSLLRIGLILAAVLASIIVGISGIVYPSMYAPLLVGGALAGFAIILAWFRKPVWALYFTIFLATLPTGIIPASIHSLLNRGMTVVALVTWVFDLIVNRRKVVWTASTFLMLGFLIWAGITLFWAVYVDRGFSVLFTYIQRFILFQFLLVNEVRKKADVNGLMKLLYITGVVIILTSGIAVVLNGYTPGTRFQLLDVNANGLGIALIVTMLGMLWEALQPDTKKTKLHKWAIAFFILLSIGVIFISGSRGSAISLLIILIFFMFWRPTRLWAYLILFTLVVAVLVAPFIFTTTINRFINPSGETLLGGREALWESGLLLVMNNLWGGVGIGNAVYAIKPLLVSSIGLEYDQVYIHNPILMIFSETGVPGILFYLGCALSAVFGMLKIAWNERKTCTKYFTSFYALLTAVFLGYMASWIKGGGMETDSTFFFFIALFAISPFLKSEDP